MRGAGFLLLLAVALAAPAASQGLWDEGGWGDIAPAGAEANVVHGRFVALGGIFGENRIDCVRCHELDGSGNTSGAFPRLTNQSPWYLYKALWDYASGARPNEIMSPIARMLSESEKRNVAAYYASVADAPILAGQAADIGVMQLGGAIAAVGIPEQGVPACTSCHGLAAADTDPTAPYLAGQFAPYLELQLLLWRQGRRDGDPFNVMERIAEAMTEEQIRAVALYYAAARPSELTDAAAAAPAPAIGLPAGVLPEAGEPAAPTPPPYLYPVEEEGPAGGSG